MTGPQLFRIPPKAGPEAYKTYEVRQPRQTHFRRGTCAEVDCRRAKTGWRSVIDVPVNANTCRYIVQPNAVDTTPVSYDVPFPADVSVCFPDVIRLPHSSP